MDGYSDTITPREFIKKQLVTKLDNIYARAGSLQIREDIMQIVDSYLRELYNSGKISDYTCVLETPNGQKSDFDPEKIVKGGSNTYYVNYTISFPFENHTHHETITIYSKGITRQINSPMDLLGVPEGVQPAQRTTISSDGSHAKGEDVFPDWSGVEKKGLT